MKKRNLVILAAAAVIAVAAAGARMETVGSDEVALRTSIIGTARVFHAGDRVFVFPGLTRLLRFRTRPVTVTFTGAGAIKVGNGDRRHEVEASVRYRLTDPALLVKSLGPSPPEAGIAAAMKDILARGLADAAGGTDSFMGTVPDRVVLSARLLEDLTAGLAPMGIAAINLDLRLRDGSGETPPQPRS